LTRARKLLPTGDPATCPWPSIIREDAVTTSLSRTAVQPLPLSPPGQSRGGQLAGIVAAPLDPATPRPSIDGFEHP